MTDEFDLPQHVHSQRAVADGFASAGRGAAWGLLALAGLVGVILYLRRR